MRTSPLIDNSRDESFLAGTGSRRRSDLQDDSDSESGREAGGPTDPQHTISKSPDGLRSVGDDHSALQLTEAPISETPEEDLSWTKRRLRSNPGQTGGTQQSPISRRSQDNYKDAKGDKEKSIDIS